MFFYTPHEIYIIYKKKKKDVTSFLALQSILNIIFIVASNLFVSYLCDNINIIWLMLILLINVVIMFVLSFGIKNIEITKSFQPKIFYKRIKLEPKIKLIYISHFFKRMSEAGVVLTLIPIILYMKLGNNFSIGIYASIASILSAILLALFVKLKNKKHVTLLVSDIILLIFSIIFIFYTKPYIYIIFYFINTIVNSFFSNSEISSLFSSVQNLDFKNFVSEHVFTYSVIGLIAEILSYLVGVVLCLLLPLEIAISIIIFLFMTTKLLAIIFMIKSDKSNLYKYKYII